MERAESSWFKEIAIMTRVPSWIRCRCLNLRDIFALIENVAYIMGMKGAGPDMTIAFSWNKGDDLAEAEALAETGGYHRRSLAGGMPRMSGW